MSKASREIYINGFQNVFFEHNCGEGTIRPSGLQGPGALIGTGWLKHQRPPDGCYP